MGEVFVQTFTPHHPSVQAARKLDYDLYFDQEVEFRRELDYPPFTHLVCVTLTGLSEQLVELTARELVRKLKPELAGHVICSDSAPAPLARAKGRYRFQVMLRAPKTREVTAPLRKVLDAFTWPRDVKHVVDVDAVSLM